MASKKLLDALNDAIAREIQVSVQYMWQHVMARGVAGETVKGVDAAELALPHRIKRGPFHQAEVNAEQLQERIEQLVGQSEEGTPSDETAPQQQESKEKKSQ